MYRFALRPRWILSHAFAIFLVVLFVNLGFWQLGRHDEKADRNALVEARVELPVTEVSSLLYGADDVESLRYRPAEASGTYLDADEVLVDNRSNDGLPGAWVLSPLRLADGRLLVVSRGFQGFASGVLEPVEAPTAPSRVVGTLLPWDGRDCGTRTDDDGTVIGMACLRRDTVESLVGEPVLPVVLQRSGSIPDDAEVLVPVPLPELDEGPHRSYAVQWFIFATIGAVGYPLILRRVAKDKARDDRLEAAIDELLSASPGPDER